jgi:hypothetical protein
MADDKKLENDLTLNAQKREKEKRKEKKCSLQKRSIALMVAVSQTVCFK